MISRKLLTAIKFHSEPAYRLAQEVEMNPSVLSKLMTGYQSVQVDDRRIVAIGELLGITSEDCFERRGEE